MLPSRRLPLTRSEVHFGRRSGRRQRMRMVSDWSKCGLLGSIPISAEAIKIAPWLTLRCSGWWIGHANATWCLNPMHSHLRHPVAAMTCRIRARLSIPIHAGACTNRGPLFTACFGRIYDALASRIRLMRMSLGPQSTDTGKWSIVHQILSNTSTVPNNPTQV